MSGFGEWIPCLEHGCIMVAGHPGPHAQLTLSHTAAASQAAEVARLRAEVERLTLERNQANVLTCVYCGQEYPPGSPTHGAEVLTAHIKVCLKHPLRQAEAERDAALRERDEAREQRNEALGWYRTSAEQRAAAEARVEKAEAESAALRARLLEARAEVARIVAIVEPRHLDGISPGTAADILYPARAWLSAGTKASGEGA